MSSGSRNSIIAVAAIAVALAAAFAAFRVSGYVSDRQEQEMEGYYGIALALCAEDLFKGDEMISALDYRFGSEARPNGIAGEIDDCTFRAYDKRREMIDEYNERQRTD